MNPKASLESKMITLSVYTFPLLCFSLALAFFHVAFDKAHAHSGGLNAYGCHAGKKPYHCHKDGSSGSGFTGSDATQLNNIPTRTFYTDSINHSDPSSMNSDIQSPLCPTYNFSELLRQAETGRIHVECKNSYLLIWGD